MATKKDKKTPPEAEPLDSPRAPPKGQHAGDYHPDTPPKGWIPLITRLWSDLARIELEARRGARGTWAIVHTWAITEPRGDVTTEAPAMARAVWKRAYEHNDSVGGPIDYRLVLRDADSTELGRSAAGARIDAAGALALDFDIEVEVAYQRLAEHALRHLMRRDDQVMRLIDQVGKTISELITAIGRLGDTAAKVAEGGAAMVDAQTRRDQAAAQAYREAAEAEAKVVARQKRREWAQSQWNTYGSTIMDHADSMVRSETAKRHAEAEAARAKARRDDAEAELINREAREPEGRDDPPSSEPPDPAQ